MKVALALSFAGLGLLAFSIIGCNGNTTVNPAISGVTYSAQPSLNVASVQLNFDPTMQTDLGGSFNIAVGGVDYGEVTLSPFTATAPFNLAFNLNPNLATDPNVAGQTPVTTIPSGQPIPAPIENASFVQLALKPIPQTAVEAYAYADVTGKQWFGVVIVINEIDAKTFPPGLVVSQGYDPDKSGTKQIWGSFFGPEVDSNGNLLVPGGLALFANISGLIAAAPDVGLTARTLANTGDYLFQGLNADYYASHPTAQLTLNQAVHDILTGPSRRK